LGKWVGILKLISVVQVVFFFFPFPSSFLFSFSHFLGFYSIYSKNWIQTKKPFLFFLGAKMSLLWQNFEFFFGGASNSMIFGKTFSSI
jgi:hypothetical protein